MMGRFQIHPRMKIGVFFIFIALVGCIDTSPKIDDAVLIRVENQVLTIREFNQVFEIAKAAYSNSVLKQPQVLKKKLYDVLYQLTDELVIKNRAAELNLVVSDVDLDKEIRAIKTDYPDETFEQILLEHSVPFGIWKERLRVRLLMEKVIKNDLIDGQVISLDDISAFWQGRRIPEKEVEGAQDKTEKDVEDVVGQLRRIKAQENYKDWINKLRTRYTITIDQQIWKKITG